MTGDSIEAFAGDPAGAAALRDGLARMADHYAGTPLGDQMSAVLSGRLGMRELAADPEFASMTTAFTREFSEEWDRLDPEQRADLVTRGDALLSEIAEPPDRR